VKHLTAFVAGLGALLLIGYIGTRVQDVGSGNTQPDSAGKRTIVWVNPLVGHPVYNMQTHAFLVAARDYGFEPVCVGPTQIDPEGIVLEIENAIAQRVDGIITVPFNWSAFKGVFEKARAAGIPIVCTGADAPKDWRLAFIGTDTKAYGRLAAQYLTDQKQGKAKICVMMSQLDVQNQVDSKDAFEEALKDQPGMEVAVVEWDKADAALAIQKFQDVFRAYPEVDTVLMLEATGGVSASKVAAEMGIADRVTILAVDDIAETVDCIRNGSVWGTLAQNFYRMGYESAAMIMDHIEGKAVEPGVDSGTTLVVQDNLATYKQEMIDAVRRKPGISTPWPEEE